MSSERRPALGTHDFDVHGAVRVRVADGSAQDLARVRRQLGLRPQAPTGEPDIVVRFVDSVTEAALTYVGLHECAFAGDDFFVLRAGGGARARARIAFDAIGARPEIVCERAMLAVPHLLAIINVTMLSKNVLPLHASAYAHGGMGVLVTGWAKGGKTESLLAAMAAGAHYVGDEWVYLSPPRRAMGLPEPIRLWEWQLRQFPALRSRRSRAQRAALSMWSHAAAIADKVAETRTAAAPALRKAAPILSRQAYVQIPPAELFGADRIAESTTIDAVVLAASHDSPEICVRPMSAAEIGRRMAASLSYERSTLLDHYSQFRYAFPDRRSTAIESTSEIESRLLIDSLSDLPAVSVFHPYPCEIAALGAAVERAVRSVVGK